MKYERLTLERDVKPEIHVNAWHVDDSSDIKGSVVIVHGMAEYSLRYKELAQYLTDHGYEVLATDHLGHGMEVSEEKNPEFDYGHWPKNGFDRSIERADLVAKYAKSVHPDKPVFLFGHSLGSFLATGIYERHPEDFSGVIICGSAYNNILYRSSTLISDIMNCFRSEKKKHEVSDFLNNSNMKTMNKRFNGFEDGYKTHNGWLSYDEDNVKAYDADKECGFPCDFLFYYSMFHGQQKVWKKSSLKKMKTKLPVFIIGGQDDPVSNYGKDIPNLYNFLKADQRGQKIEMKLYPHAKHEILNESGVKEEVKKDILDFYNSCLK